MSKNSKLLPNRRISFQENFKPINKENARYKGVAGGRGSGKSWVMADYVISRISQNPNINIVCLREVQLSIKYSSKKLLEDRMAHYDLLGDFEMLSTEIKSKRGKGVIIFKGLRDFTADSIKSLEGFDIAWIEEAQTITKHSLDLLTPTIRSDGSEILFSWNPQFREDAVEELFRKNSSNAILIKANYVDNKFCPKSIYAEAQQMMKNDYEGYLHTYLGNYKTRSESQIFKDKFTVVNFDSDEIPTAKDKYYGLDFGFSIDPSACISCYVVENALYINSESGGVGIEIVDTHLLLDKVLDRKNNLVYGDSARPEVISHIQNQGYNIVSVAKWKGSIEDGISFLRGLDHIYISDECVEIANEFVHYSYKIDRAGNITSNIIDKHNHYLDALRYALGDLIRSNLSTWDY